MPRKLDFIGGSFVLNDAEGNNIQLDSNDPYLINNVFSSGYRGLTLTNSAWAKIKQMIMNNEAPPPNYIGSIEEASTGMEQVVKSMTSAINGSWAQLLEENSIFRKEIDDTWNWLEDMSGVVDGGIDVKTAEIWRWLEDVSGVVTAGTGTMGEMWRWLEDVSGMLVDGVGGGGGAATIEETKHTDENGLVSTNSKIILGGPIHGLRQGSWELSTSVDPYFGYYKRQINFSENFDIGVNNLILMNEQYEKEGYSFDFTALEEYDLNGNTFYKVPEVEYTICNKALRGANANRGEWSQDSGGLYHDLLYRVNHEGLHRFYGEYTSFNTASHNGGGRKGMIGFTTYLSGAFTTNRYPVLACEGDYLYLSTNNKIGERTGGTYAGNISSQGFRKPSDKRLKKDIITIPNPLDIISKMRGVHFHWNEISGKQTNKRQTGFIANEVQEVLPDVCDYDENTDCWGIYEEDVTAVLVEGMKQQQAEIELLKSQMAELLSKINT